MQKEICNINDLPEEIVSVVTEYVGVDTLALLQHINSFFRSLQWVLTEGGYPEELASRPNFLMSIAAHGGNIEIMKWLRERSPPCSWSEVCCLSAVRNGQLEALKWLREQRPPCPWDELSVHAARGHVDMLLWMRSLPTSELPVTIDQVGELLQESIWELGEALIERRDLGPLMKIMKKGSLVPGSEEVLVVCLSILRGRVEVDDPIVNEHIEFIGPFALNALKSTHFETSHTSAVLLNEIIVKRPYFLVKKDMVKMLIDGFTDSFACDVWFHSLPSVKENCSSKIEVLDRTIICIDCLAQQVPTKHLISAAMSKFRECVNSPDGLIRKAGFVMFGTIIEGCADAIRLMLPTLLPEVLQYVSDSHYAVREGVMYVLLQMAQHCYPTVLYHHTTIVPAIVSGLNDTEPTVQRLACRLCEFFFEQLQPSTVALYLPVFMPKLVALMSSEVLDVKLVAIGSTGPVAAAADKHYLPFLQESVNNLTTSLQAIGNSLDDKDILLQGQMIESLGQYAIAVGRDSFSPFLNFAMTTVIDIIKSQIVVDGPGLEFAFVFVANIAKAMEGDATYHSYVDIVYPYLQRNALEGFSENNQVAALTAIGSLARFMCGSFDKYLDSSNEVVSVALTSPNPMVQSAALKILPFFVVVAGTACGCSNPAHAKGKMLKISGKLSVTLNRVMDWLWNTISTHIDMPTVMSALEALRCVIDYCGIVSMSIRELKSFQTFDELYKVKLLEYLNENAPCQRARLSENDEDGEDDHHDRLVLPSVCDVIEALAKASGEQYLATFELYIPLLMKFTDESKSFSASSMVVGCFANSMSEMGPSAMQHVDLILPVLQRDCMDEMEENRRNACFCLAVVIEGLSTDALQLYIPRFLDWLLPLVVRNSSNVKSGDNGDADVDNAVAAVCRIISKCPCHEEIPKLLPMIVAALPLTSDHSENESVFAMLTMIVSSSVTAPYTIISFIDILKAFVHAIHSDSPCPKGVSKSVKACLRFLSSPEYKGSLDLKSSMQSLPLSDCTVISDALLEDEALR